MMASRKILYIMACTALAFTPAAARDFVHILTSKEIYETCEDMWFKGLVLNDSTLRLSDRAHTAFVEIVNQADSVVWKEKYPVVDGECDGQIYIGDDWETGEYRMYVNTWNTLGASDSTIYPKRLLIVNELPEAQNLVTYPSGQPSVSEPDTVFRHLRPLNVTVELDSAEYHTRSTVKARLSVTDFNGNPVRAKVALSVYDRLYDYPSRNPGLLSHCHGRTSYGNQSHNDPMDIFLTDGPVSGRLKAKKNRSDLSPGGLFINVFDFSDTTGSLNIVETEENGCFEVPSEIASALGWELLLKPVSGQKLKPELVFYDSFASIENVRKHSEDRYFPDIHMDGCVSEELDSLDFTGRRIVRLDEVVVNGHAGKYPKRNKLMGRLDSISSIHGNAWVCGCPAGHGTSFLNDYIPGYTHHPSGYGHPLKPSLPVKGKSYEVIKYSGGTIDDHVVDIQYVEYTGPRYSDEELLRKNGLWKNKGYYPPHKFVIPSEEDMEYVIEDNRNTLIWMAGVMTDENGILETVFPTSDIVSTFILRTIAWRTDDYGLGEAVSKVRVTARN